MDTLRGNFGSTGYDAGQEDYDVSEDDTGRDLPPAAIGTDERRMQVRAYNHWAGLLQDRNFPSIEDLEPENLSDFGPYSVLLDFTSGIEDPAILHLGQELASECGTDVEIQQLSDVPSRSLLSRITDHYMQILANQAPIGFEAEFVNQRGATILYRGILLPYSSDGETIDFILGAINWKEMADQATTDELLLDLDQALEESAPQVDDRAEDPVAEWADGPVSESEEPVDAADDAVSDIFSVSAEPAEHDFPAPEFGAESEAETAEDEEDYADDSADIYDETANDDAVTERLSSLIQPKSLADQCKALLADAENEETPVEELQPAQPDFEPSDQLEGVEAVADVEQNHEPVEAPVVEETVIAKSSNDLYDCLAEARELAQQASSSEDRTRQALYAAVGRAYDVSLAAEESPEDFEELVVENGLTVQDRAPMTPVVKLVFGADYDKTRLTEYAAVLAHAQRAGVERGELAGYLSGAEGGLKGIVQAERRIRKEESGKTVDPVDAVKPAIAKKLRKVTGHPLASIDPQGEEFGVVMIRRTEDGEIVVIGEVADDIALVEKVARKLLG